MRMRKHSGSIARTKGSSKSVALHCMVLPKPDSTRSITVEAQQAGTIHVGGHSQHKHLEFYFIFFILIFVHPEIQSE